MPHLGGSLATLQNYNVQLETQDIQIGAVELKDHDSALRTDVKTVGAENALVTTSAAAAGSTQVSPKMLRGTGSVTLTGAVPQAAVASLVFGSNPSKGKIKRVLATRTVTGGTPYALFDVEILDVDPATIAGLAAGSNHDGRHTVALFTALVPVASGAPAGSFRVLNLVPVAEIMEQNQDGPTTDKLYVRVRGTVGGGAGTDTVVLLIDGEEAL